MFPRQESQLGLLPFNKIFQYEFVSVKISESGLQDTPEKSKTEGKMLHFLKFDYFFYMLRRSSPQIIKLFGRGNYSLHVFLLEFQSVL